MSQRYLSLIVAKFFIDLADSQGRAATPLKLQKIVYYAAGWYAGFTGLRLIDEEIKAWPYGPVIDSIFQEFKHLGNEPIKASDVRYGVIDTGTPMFGADLERFLSHIWDAYRDYSDESLSEMTKADGSPWATTVGASALVRQSIPFDVFSAYFATVVANTASVK